MIVSHKHKFIFLKTHKTATQSFYNAIKPHLGKNDVSLGDQRVADAAYNKSRPPKDWKYIDTSLNIDQVFPTGKTGKEAQDKMGNHIPWFVVKDIVGEEIWNTYTKFSIERKPKDRIISLFYFLERTIANPGLYRINPESDLIKSGSDLIVGRAGNPKVGYQFYKFKNDETTALSYDPDGCRKYFEDWVLCQLLCEKLPLCEESTYSSEIVPHERKLLLQSNKNNKLNAMFQNEKDRIKLKLKNDCYMESPYINKNILLFDRQFNNPEQNGFGRYLSLEGQCRFWNYGYYYDGKNMQIDHLVPYSKDVSVGFNSFFKKFNINIQFKPGEFDKKTLNTESRKSLKTHMPVDWWYSGKRGRKINKLIDKEFKFINI